MLTIQLADTVIRTDCFLERPSKCLSHCGEVPPVAVMTVGHVTVTSPFGSERPMCDGLVLASGHNCKRLAVFVNWCKGLVTFKYRERETMGCSERQ